LSRGSNSLNSALGPKPAIQIFLLSKHKSQLSTCESIKIIKLLKKSVNLEDIFTVHKLNPNPFFQDGFGYASKSSVYVKGSDRQCMVVELRI